LHWYVLTEFPLIVWTSMSDFAANVRFWKWNCKAR
jgi:hypothetical protein